MFPSLCASINAVIDGAHLHPSTRSLMVQAALCVFTSLCFVNELPVLFADFHDHIADLFSFARMIREEFIRLCEQHMPRVPEAYQPPSSADPSPPSSCGTPVISAAAYQCGKEGRLCQSSPAPPQRPAHVVASSRHGQQHRGIKDYLMIIR